MSDRVYSLAIEAAEDIGDNRLLSALVFLKEWWDEDQDLLTRAIKNCQ